MSQDLPPEIKRQMFRARRVARAKGILQGLQVALRPGDLVIDCGANVGSVAGPLAATGATVICFEPDPEPFKELDKALGALDNVELAAVAVGIKAGKVPLFRGERFEENPIVASRRSTIMPGANRMEGAALEVEVANLIPLLQDWVARPGGIAFLKLDVEGAELDILTEMLRLDLFSGIGLTVAELHGYKFPQLKPEFDALRRTIKARYPEDRVWLDWI